MNLWHQYYSPMLSGYPKLHPHLPPRKATVTPTALVQCQWSTITVKAPNLCANSCLNDHDPRTKPLSPSVRCASAAPARPYVSLRCVSL